MKSNEISSDAESWNHYFPTPLPAQKPKGRLHGWRTKEEARKRRHDVPAPPAPLSQPIRSSAVPASPLPELLFFEDVNEESSASSPLSELLMREAKQAIEPIPVSRKLEKPPPQVLGLVCKKLWSLDTKPKNEPVSAATSHSADENNQQFRTRQSQPTDEESADPKISHLQ